MTQYYQLSEENIFDYIATIDALVNLIGSDRENWTVKEIGDGNVNFIFLIKGANGAFVAKQAAPFIRIAPTWALTADRIYFEREWFQEVAKYCQDYLPEILYFNRDMSLMCEQYLTPDIILRNGMIDGIVYPKFAEQISTFLARSLFYTSDLYMSRAEKQDMVRKFSENVLMHITEGVIFTEPFIDHENNRHNPLIEDAAKEIKNDVQLKLKVSHFKNRFMSSAEALLHADLHTGSIMLSQDTTYVIDSEFTSVGPMGFDLGLLVGNLILSYLSQQAHENRTDYQAWIKTTINDVWNKFSSKFRELWNNERKGELYNFMGDDQEAIAQAQNQYLAMVLNDTIGFAGIVMIRRTLGIAHVEDIEGIKDEVKRAEIETQCLNYGRQFVLRSEEFTSIEELTNELQ